MAFRPKSSAASMGSRQRLSTTGKANTGAWKSLIVGICSLYCYSNYLKPKEKIEWSTRLDRAIVKAIRAPVDLLLNSEEEIRQKQQLPGHIIRSVMREGMAL